MTDYPPPSEPPYGGDVPAPAPTMNDDPLPDLFTDAGVPPPPVTRLVVMILVGLGVVLASLFAVWYIASDLARARADAARFDRLEAGISDRQETIDALVVNYEALQAELAARGIPDDAPTADEIVDGDTAEPPAPTAAQVELAVAVYCATGNRCQGPAGKPGPSPTPGEVAAAVASFCADGGCSGPVGPAGAQGEPGATGATGDTGATGQPGAGVTDEQIAAAVAGYCADGACVGPAGPAGADGRGIVDTRCEGDVFVVEYTDGTTDEVDGSTACEPFPPGLP